MPPTDYTHQSPRNEINFTLHFLLATTLIPLWHSHEPLGSQTRVTATGSAWRKAAIVRDGSHRMGDWSGKELSCFQGEDFFSVINQEKKAVLPTFQFASRLPGPFPNVKTTRCQNWLPPVGSSEIFCVIRISVCNRNLKSAREKNETWGHQICYVDWVCIRFTFKSQPAMDAWRVTAGLSYTLGSPFLTDWLLLGAQKGGGENNVCHSALLGRRTKWTFTDDVGNHFGSPLGRKNRV